MAIAWVEFQDDEDLPEWGDRQGLCVEGVAGVFRWIDAAMLIHV